MLHAIDILQINIKSLFSGEDSLETCKGPFTQGGFCALFISLLVVCAHAQQTSLVVVMHLAVFGIFQEAFEVEMHILKHCTTAQLSVLQQWTSQMNLGAGKASPVDRACILATVCGNA